MASLRALAKQSKSFRIVAAYLVLARYSSGIKIGGYEPFTFSGAGMNAVKRDGCMSDAWTAHSVNYLKENGWLEAPPQEIRDAYPRAANFKVLRGDLDVCIPHSFVDGLDNKRVDSGIKRITHCITPLRHKKELAADDQDALKLDALMLMLEMYAATDMVGFGGVSPWVMRRKWETPSKSKAGLGYQWLSEASVDYTWRADSLMAYTAINAGKKETLPNNYKERLWNASDMLKSVGLIYEAVCWFSGDAKTDRWPEAGDLLCTVRVNDFHADSRGTRPDPSYQAALNDTVFCFYKQASDGEPEGIRVVLPTDGGDLVGIYRPRFRARTPDAGAWLEDDEASCQRYASMIPPL